MKIFGYLSILVILLVSLVHIVMPLEQDDNRNILQRKKGTSIARGTSKQRHCNVRTIYQRWNNV